MSEESEVDPKAARANAVTWLQMASSANAQRKPSVDYARTAKGILDRCVEGLKKDQHHNPAELFRDLYDEIERWTGEDVGDPEWTKPIELQGVASNACSQLASRMMMVINVIKFGIERRFALEERMTILEKELRKINTRLDRHIAEPHPNTTPTCSDPQFDAFRKDLEQLRARQDSTQDNVQELIDQVKAMQDQTSSTSERLPDSMQRIESKLDDLLEKADFYFRNGYNGGRYDRKFPKEKP